MIRKTLDETKSATWCISLADPTKGNLPIPAGTGFFISEDGWMLTAAHVVCDDSGNIKQTGAINGTLGQYPLDNPKSLGILGGFSVHWVNQDEDIALLKIDWNRGFAEIQKHVHGGVPYLKLSTKTLDEGTPVYSFGYPLSDFKLIQMSQTGASSETYLSPRTTSAIISSIYQGVQQMNNPNIKVYVLDKALNYGNSGGPIVDAESGKVHAICSRFHPVFIPQQHIPDQNNNPILIMIPSLYGYATSIANIGILEELKKLGIQVEE